MDGRATDNLPRLQTSDTQDTGPAFSVLILSGAAYWVVMEGSLKMINLSLCSILSPEIATCTKCTVLEMKEFYNLCKGFFCNIVSVVQLEEAVDRIYSARCLHYIPQYTTTYLKQTESWSNPEPPKSDNLITPSSLSRIFAEEWCMRITKVRNERER
eukprot:sb/3473085/